MARLVESATGVDVAFALLGAVALVSGCLVVTSRQVVHAALWLVVSLGAVAGCFLLLTAEFVAWLQVLIYLGAVVVLLLFALMLTRAPIGPLPSLTGTNRTMALFVSTALTLVLAALVLDAYGSTRLDLDTHQSSASVIGEAMFTYWVLPFEALSVLLLAALVGAIVVSKPQQEE